jgi:peptidoglycan/xylan/chitin deacetylase (PgdA/CDA1 family)
MVKALQFHRIAPKVQFCGTWNYPEQFERFIHFLKCRVRLILPGEDSNGIVITFDDGDKSVYQYAFPILKKYGTRAVVFLIVDYIGKADHWDIALAGRRSPHLSWDEITEMNDWGIVFGSHTMSHRNLTKLKREEIVYELCGSKQTLESRLGAVECISYPFNRVNAEVALVAKRAGYRFGFGGSGDGNMLIKKEAVYITDNTGSLATKISEQPWILYRYDRVKQKVINYFTMTTMLAKRWSRG